MILMLNILWFVLGGGLVAGVLWALAGVVMFISIVGIPWGHSCFRIANLSFFPFGRTTVDRSMITAEDDLGTGALGLLGNIVWFVLAGIWLGLAHLAAGVSYCLTIIGIPFGIQHFKLAGLCLAPVGKAIVPVEVAEQARQRSARAYLDARRRG